MAGATKYVDNVLGSDANPGNAPGAGNAYASIAYAVSQISGGGNTIYVKNNAGSPYPGGNVLTAALKGDTTDGRNRLEGYTTTPGARDGRPTVTSATTSQILFTLNDNDYWEFVHLKLTHTGTTRGFAFGFTTTATSPWWGTDLVCDGCSQLTPNNGLNGVMYLEGVEVKSCTGTYAVGVGTAGYLWGCYVHDNPGDGVRGTAGTTGTFSLVSCVIASNAGIGVSDTSTNANVVLTVRGCAIWLNGGSGVKSLAKTANATTWDLCNNVIGANGTSGTGYNIESLDPQAESDANARQNRSNFYYTSATGYNTGLSLGYGAVTLTGDPFANAAAGDFSLNTAAGAGAAVRAAGFPHAFPGGTTTSYLDGGAAQHQDLSGVTGVAYW